MASGYTACHVTCLVNVKQQVNGRKMAKSKVGICAVILSIIAFLFILTAFCSGYWLVNDGKVDNPQFKRIGLWEVCFENFEDFRHHYDTKFTGCWWVFEEEYYIIHDFLLPGFFIATQFFFTLCMTLVLVSVSLSWLYCFCNRTHDKYIILLMSNAIDHWMAGTCGLISVLIFGFNGDSRDWMPYWQHNDLGFSYAFAVIGSLLLFPAGALYFTEARRARYRELQNSRPQSQYSMDIPKPSHTDI